MKKKVFISIIITLTILMAGFNMYTTREREELFQLSSLVVEDKRNPDKSIVLSGEQMAELTLETIQVTYQRKVGAPEEKTYQGIALSALLQEAGISEQNTASVAVTARDQYQIELTAEEIFMADHAYLVLMEEEKHLTEEEGDYMLVLCKDKLSTRWVKQVVGIEWTRLDYE